MTQQGWTWTYEDAAGAPVAAEGAVTAPFPTRSDAETWLGESWQELAEAGVARVTLHEDGAPVYGPMSLDAG